MRRINMLQSAEPLVFGSALCATLGQLGIKLGLGPATTFWTTSVSILPRSLTLGIVLGLAVYGLGTLLWIRAVSLREISYLYPLASLNYVFVALCGHFVLKEPLAFSRSMGIVVMTSGIVMLTLVARKPALPESL